MLSGTIPAKPCTAAGTRLARAHPGHLHSKSSKPLFGALARGPRAQFLWIEEFLYAPQRQKVHSLAFAPLAMAATSSLTLQGKIGRRQPPEAAAPALEERV